MLFAMAFLCIYGTVFLVVLITFNDKVFLACGS